MSDSPLARLAAEESGIREEKGTVHTPAEILKQPEMWRRTARLVGGLEKNAEALRRTHDDYLVLSGAGSSLNAAGMVAELLRDDMGPRISAVSGKNILLGPGRYVPA